MSTLTTIQSTDLITNSRANINDNFAALNADKLETSVLDTDTTLAANSDSKVPTQAAVKAYVDAGGNVNASETNKGIVEEATQDEADLGTEVGVTGARLFINPSKMPRAISTDFSSTGTWTKPGKGNTVFIEAWGGGGSGGATEKGLSYPRSAASGGGGGEYRSIYIPISLLPATVAVTIGAGGASVVASGNNELSGNVGGDTSFGAYLVAKGGSGGAADTNELNASAGGVAGGRAGSSDFLAIKNENGGASGTASASNSPTIAVANPGADTTYSGAGGGSASFGGQPATIFSAGGTSTFGGNGGSGAAADSGNQTGTAGTEKGGGGGGACCTSGSTATSGAGGDGFVRVTVF